jgi:putative ABC transport system substrate-binding protein
MRQRDLIALLGSAAACPLTVRAQQPAMPTIGYLSLRSPDVEAQLVAAFRRGLSETGYVEGRNVAIEIAGLRVDTIACRSLRTCLLLELP